MTMTMPHAFSALSRRSRTLPTSCRESRPGPEKPRLTDSDISFHESEYKRLRGELQSAHDTSRLPELPSEETRAALNDLLARVRLARFS